MKKAKGSDVFVAGQPPSFFADEFFCIARSAQVLGGLSESTIRKWLIEGKLKGAKVGDRVMIRASELAKMVRE